MKAKEPLIIRTAHVKNISDNFHSNMVALRTNVFFLSRMGQCIKRG